MPSSALCRAASARAARSRCWSSLGVRRCRRSWTGTVAARAPRNASPHEVPPLHGLWQPKLLGPGTLPGGRRSPLLGWRYAADLADAAAVAPAAARVVRRARWPGCSSLALVDGTDGLSRVLGNPYEYLRTAREVGDVGTPARHLRRAGSRTPPPTTGPPTWPGTRRGAAVLRRAGQARARRRLRRRASWSTVLAATTAVGRAGDAARARRRGRWPGGRRRSWC